MTDHRTAVIEKVLEALFFLLLRLDYSLRLTNDLTINSHDCRRFPNAHHIGQTNAHDWGEKKQTARKPPGSH